MGADNVARVQNLARIGTEQQNEPLRRGDDRHIGRRKPKRWKR